VQSVTAFLYRSFHSFLHFASAGSFLYINFSMPDNLLLIVFGILSTIGLLVGGIAIYLAMQSAKKKDGELMMAFWAFIALAGLTFAGMSWAYFIIPILANRLF
jgi:heme/copper-type cytochrome/quinol oxidase subunit 3